MLATGAVLVVWNASSMSAALAALGDDGDGTPATVSICPDVSSGDNSVTQAPAGCGSPVSPASTTTDGGTFSCQDNPLGFFVLTDPSTGYSWTLSGAGLVNPLLGAGTTNTSGDDLASFGAITAGDYTLTVTPDNSSPTTVTFTVGSCAPPPPTKPGCGAGDTNHSHTGPPNTSYRFVPSRCPAASGHAAA